MRIFNQPISLRTASFAILLALFCSFQQSCKKTDLPAAPDPVDTTVVTPAFDINSINDTYAELAPFANYAKWGPHNVHDPAIIKEGEYYYSYTTDVGFGIDVRPGLQVRRSKDLVKWDFMGWVFTGLPTLGSQFITSSGGTPFNALWAPYVIKVGSEFRLYYSLSSAKPRLSAIGLATATSPLGPWTEKGLAVTSKDDASIQTNAIDPTVIITETNEHFMYYGSGWDGIYMLKLDASKGLAATIGDKGKRVANRGFTGGKYNGNIEGPEIIYHPGFKKYYLFIAYDWLQTKYNVRVCRSDKPEGPFLDFEGKDANTNVDHGPMIVAPYKFEGHSGWQGVAHCAVFNDGAGQYFMAHQGRPGVNSFFMNMQVRKMFWNSDGWPVVSPERYAWEDNAAVPRENITGSWEQIILGYRVVPGYDQEQTSPDFQVSQLLNIDAAGTLNGDAASTWTYNAPWLEMKWGNGFTDKVFIQKGRDWENKKNSIIFTGLNNTGTAIWGKKK